MEKQMELPLTYHPARTLGGAFRDYVREVLAGESAVPNPVSNPNRAEQRWEDEGGSSR